jgi:SAM-dependent methyltransferase
MRGAARCAAPVRVCIGGYEARFGVRELRPVTGVRSNSFNYVEQRRIAWAAGASCPILTDGTTPYDPGRSLLVRRGEEFASTARRRAISPTSKSSTPSGGSNRCTWTSATRRARRFRARSSQAGTGPECATCPAYETCTRCYRIVDEDIFTRDDAELMTLLQELRGDVLDVGCGDTRYGQVLEPLVRTGRSYQGVEPNAEAAAASAHAGLGASTVSPVESLDLDRASYDHILVLRATTTCAIRESARRLTRALRPGGTLLSRTTSPSAWFANSSMRGARSRTSVFEHYRNDASDQARIRSRPASGIDRRADVGAGTSNQWYLQYRRAPRRTAVLGGLRAARSRARAIVRAESSSQSATARIPVRPAIGHSRVTEKARSRTHD